MYVQHKIAEHGPEIYRWLEEGSHFYICGDMKKMARDVQNTLTAIIAKEKGVSHDYALDYVNRLQKEKRLQMDVY
jgi:sulfite reductase (NADPH) flavoprotein alpha-component